MSRPTGHLNVILWVSECVEQTCWANTMGHELREGYCSVWTKTSFRSPVVYIMAYIFTKHSSFKQYLVEN